MSISMAVFTWMTGHMMRLSFLTTLLVSDIWKLHMVIILGHVTHKFDHWMVYNMALTLICYQSIMQANADAPLVTPYKTKSSADYLPINNFRLIKLDAIWTSVSPCTVKKPILLTIIKEILLNSSFFISPTSWIYQLWFAAILNSLFMICCHIEFIIHDFTTILVE